MFIKLPALLLAILLVGGCSRKPEPAAPAPVAPPPAARASGVPVAPSPAIPAPPPESSSPTTPASRPEPVATYQVDANLQKILVRFYDDNQRPAMAWEDLLGRYIPAIPRGPDGKPLEWNSTMQRIGRASDRSRK